MSKAIDREDYYERLWRMVRDRMQDSHNHRAKKVEKWLDHYEAYRCYLRTDNNYPWRSRIYYPLTFAAIELKLAKIVGSIFASMPPVTAKAAHPMWEERAWVVTQLVAHQMEAEMRLMVPYTEHLKSVLIYGTGVAFMPYRIESRAMKERIMQRRNDFFSALAVPETVENLTVVETYNGPAFEPMDITDFFPAPGSRSAKDMRWAIRRADITRSQLDDYVNQGIYIKEQADKLREAIDQGVNYGNDQSLLAEDGHSAIDSSRASIAKIDTYRDKGRIAILEYYGDANIEMKEGKKERPSIVTIAKDYPGIVLRVEPDLTYTSHPFIVDRDFAVPNEFYGMSESDVLEGIQAGINTTVNQTVDNMSLAINHMYAIGQGAEVDEQDLSSVPGRLIHVQGDLAQFKEIVGKDMPRTPFSLIDLYRSAADQATGQYDVTRGDVSDMPATTATAVVQALAQGNARFDMAVRLIAQDSLCAIAQKMLELDQQFMPDEKFIEILGEYGQEWAQIDINMIAGRYQFFPVASVMAGNKQGQQQALIMAKQMLDADPILSQLYDRRELGRQILSSLEIPHADRLLSGAGPAAAGQGPGGMGMMPEPGGEQNGDVGGVPGQGGSPGPGEIGATQGLSEQAVGLMQGAGGLL